ncbi:F-box/LRR-repeat protein 12-like isoform X2 [Aphidius gifuensis]|nr:F-box/LRR-repeat protein 12-like isoform X2 [Aphidius gifuensis]
MIIEHVNNDCLAEIFMYVPAWERPKIALVCKKWKRVLDDYSWFNVKKLEFTHWEYDEYPHFLKGNYPTIDGQFNFLQSLLYKCGRYLRELDLSVYDHCNIVPVINEYCPNLEKLQIRIRVYDHVILTNAFTNLSKLKVLKIIFHGCLTGACLFVPQAIIKSLLNVADTLTDLNLSNWAIAMIEIAHFTEEMTNVISQLKVLRQFVMTGLDCHETLYDYVHNSKTIRTICDDSGLIGNKIDDMMPFENIEVLDISDWLITDDGVYMIANTMKQLHRLHVACSWLTDAGIVACTKMNNLKFLDFCGFNSTTDSSIKLLKNKTHLKLPCSNEISDESAIKVLENSPEMIRYSIGNTGITHKLIEKAAEISRNRKRQLIIWVTLERDMSNTQVEYEYLTVDYVEKEKQENENHIFY